MVNEDHIIIEETINDAIKSIKHFAKLKKTNQTSNKFEIVVDIICSDIVGHTKTVTENGAKDQYFGNLNKSKKQGLLFQNKNLVVREPTQEELNKYLTVSPVIDIKGKMLNLAHYLNPANDDAKSLYRHLQYQSSDSILRLKENDTNLAGNIFHNHQKEFWETTLKSVINRLNNSIAEAQNALEILNAIEIEKETD